MKYQLAPMEGLTTYIYRTVLSHYTDKVDTYYTPFISPHKDKSINNKERNEILPENNQGMRVIPQILTASAEDFIKTSKEIKEYGYDEINLNIGCPSGTVTTKGKGAGLLLNTTKLDDFLYEIFDKSSVKISIKTRIGYFESSEWEDIAEVYKKYPFTSLIIHPRVRQDFYKNVPDMDVWDKALQEFKDKLIYNGNLFLPDDINGFQSKYPEVDTCMIGRGLIGNPFLIDEAEDNYIIDKHRLRQFHDEIYDEYCRTMSGDTNAIYRMKEVWFYLFSLFEPEEKYIKKVRKANKRQDYMLAVNAIFRDLDILPPKDRSICY